MGGKIEINHEISGFHDALLRHSAILSLFEKNIPYEEMSHDMAQDALQELLEPDFPDQALAERLRSEGISEPQFQLYRSILEEAAGYVLAGKYSLMVPSKYGILENGAQKDIEINTDVVFQTALYLATNLYQGGRKDLFDKLTPHSSIASTIHRALAQLPEAKQTLEGQFIEWLHIGSK